MLVNTLDAVDQLRNHTAMFLVVIATVTVTVLQLVIAAMMFLWSAVVIFVIN